MGTPLSFVVLSWINAWAASAFSARRIRGDDAVGWASTDLELRSQYLEYRAAIAAVGGRANDAKTFISQDAFTFCETIALAHPARRRMAVFRVPSIPGPGIEAPSSLEIGLSRKWQRRAERVVRARFPWVVKDPRLHIPVEFGGFGYLGKGLDVPVPVRKRLAAAVSRRDQADSFAYFGKKAFRERGAFPRPFAPAPVLGKEFMRIEATHTRVVARDNVPQTGRRWQVPARWLAGEVAHRALAQYVAVYGATRRQGVGGRPERTRARPFRKCKDTWSTCRPLGRHTGVASLARLAAFYRDQSWEVSENFVTTNRRRPAVFSIREGTEPVE
jgi:hypothetical protein